MVLMEDKRGMCGIINGRKNMQLKKQCKIETSANFFTDKDAYHYLTTINHKIKTRTVRII